MSLASRRYENILLLPMLPQKFDRRNMSYITELLFTFHPSLTERNYIFISLTEA